MLASASACIAIDTTGSLMNTLFSLMTAGFNYRINKSYFFSQECETLAQAAPREPSMIRSESTWERKALYEQILRLSINILL